MFYRRTTNVVERWPSESSTIKCHTSSSQPESELTAGIRTNGKNRRNETNRTNKGIDASYILVGRIYFFSVTTMFYYVNMYTIFNGPSGAFFTTFQCPDMSTKTSRTLSSEMLDH